MHNKSPLKIEGIYHIEGIVSGKFIEKWQSSILRCKRCNTLLSIYGFGDYGWCVKCSMIWTLFSSRGSRLCQKLIKKTPLQLKRLLKIIKKRIKKKGEYLMSKKTSLQLKILELECEVLMKRKELELLESIIKRLKGPEGKTKEDKS